MKELLVSLDVTSPSLTLGEISAKLGRSPSYESSHDKGEPRFGRERFDHAIWRLNSTAQKTEPLEEHLATIAAQFPPEALPASATLTDCTIWINVGLLFDTPSSSVLVTRRALDIIHRYGAVLEVTCYPST